MTLYIKYNDLIDDVYLFFSVITSFHIISFSVRVKENTIIYIETLDLDP